MATKPIDEPLGVQEEVPVPGIITALQKEALKKYNNRELWIFAVLITFIILLMLTERFQDYYSPRYFVTEASENLMGLHQFRTIDKEHHFWDWFREFPLDALWNQTAPPSGTHNFHRTRNIPLSFLLMRQFRVEPSECLLSNIEKNTFPPSIQKQLPKICVNQYSDATASLDPYGPNNAFIPNSMRREKARSVDLTGDLRSYKRQSAAFQFELFFNRTTLDVLHDIEFMEKNYWIDNETRAISTELLIFNPEVTFFCWTAAILEITETGFVQTSTRSSTFSLHNWTLRSARSVFIFVLDCLIACINVYTLFSFCQNLWVNFRVRGQLFTLFDGIMLSSIGVLLVVNSFRIQFWITVLTVFDENFFAEHQSEIEEQNGGNLVFWWWDWILGTLELHENIWFLYGLCILGLLARLMGFLHFVARLNALTNTLRHALPELMSMLLLFLIIIGGYSSLGHILYGDTVEGFRSVMKAGGSLLVFLTGSREHYEDMVRAHSVFTTLYVVSYMAIVWVLVLNLVLAILTGSYADVSEAMDSPEWSVNSILKDMRGSMIYATQGLQKKGASQQQTKGMRSKDLNLSQQTSIDITKRLRQQMQRMEAEHADDDHALDASRFISVQDFKHYAPELTDAEHLILLERAKKGWSGKDNNAMHKVMRQIRNLHKDVIGSLGYLDTVQLDLFSTAAETNERMRRLPDQITGVGISQHVMEKASVSQHVQLRRDIDIVIDQLSTLRTQLHMQPMNGFGGPGMPGMPGMGGMPGGGGGGMGRMVTPPGGSLPPPNPFGPSLPPSNDYIAQAAQHAVHQAVSAITPQPQSALAVGRSGTPNNNSSGTLRKGAILRDNSPKIIPITPDSLHNGTIVPTMNQNGNVIPFPLQTSSASETSSMGIPTPPPPPPPPPQTTSSTTTTTTTHPPPNVQPTAGVHSQQPRSRSNSHHSAATIGGGGSGGGGSVGTSTTLLPPTTGNHHQHRHSRQNSFTNIDLQQDRKPSTTTAPSEGTGLYNGRGLANTTPHNPGGPAGGSVTSSDHRAKTLSRDAFAPPLPIKSNKL